MPFKQPGGHRIRGEQQHVSISETALTDLDSILQRFAVRPGADQIRAHGELRRSLQGKRFDRTHPFTDVIDVHKATVTNGQRRPTVLVSVNLDTEKSRKGTLLGLFASEPGERSAHWSSPPEAARWLQPRKKLCPGELTAHIALGQQHRPELGKTAFGGAVSHRHADADWGASLPMRPGILVLLKAVAQLWAAEDPYVALVRRVACFTAGGAHCSGHSAQMHISRSRADIEKMDYVQRLRVKDESSRVFLGRHTQLCRACNHERCERR